MPVVKRDLIIKSFIDAEKQCTEVTDIIQFIRLSIKRDLPGNSSGSTLIPVPMQIAEELARDVMNKEGKTFLAMEPENCQNMLSDIRDLVAAYPKTEDLVLLIEDTKLRIHLRKLVELEFPQLMVISKEELIKI